MSLTAKALVAQRSMAPVVEATYAAIGVARGGRPQAMYDALDELIASSAPRPAELTQVGGSTCRRTGRS